MKGTGTLAMAFRRAAPLAAFAAFCVLTGAVQAQTSPHGHAPPPPHKPAAAGPRDMKDAMMSGVHDMQQVPTTGDVDRDFALLMKLHHEQALPMAELQLARGKSPELKALARQIIATQKREIAQFDRWLARHR